MQLVAKLFLILFPFFLTSCFIGPVKELKIQLEESWKDDSVPTNPAILSNDVAVLDTNFLWEIQLSENPRHNLELSICSNKIFVSNNKGALYALNKENGDIIWEKEISKPIIAGITCDDSQVYFVTSDGFAWALKSDGLKLWKTFVGQVYSPPLIIDQSVIYKTTSNQFISLNVINGFQNWLYQSLSPPLTIESWGKLNSSDGVIYSGLPSGKCLALDLNTGALIWESSYSFPKGKTDIERANDTTSQPIISEQFLYVVSSKGNLAMLDRITGTVLWSRALSSFYGIELIDDSLIVIHNSGTIYSISSETSKVNWRNADFVNRKIKNSKFFLDHIIIGDYEGYIHLVNVKSGKTIYRFKVSNNSINNYLPLIDKLLVLDKANNIKLVSINIPKKTDSKKLGDDLKSKSIINNNGNDIKNDTSFFDELIFWD